jgi:hypothetical protein
VGVRESSLGAYRSVDLQQREREVMLACHRHFPAPARFTRKELAKALGWEINRVTGRVLTLIERGFLTEHDDTRDGGHLLSITQPNEPSRMPDERGNPEFRTQAGSPTAAPQPSTATITAAPSREGVGQGEVAAAAPGSALDIARKNAARVAALREAMPGTAANLDYWRQWFDKASIVHAIEGTKQYGYPTPKGVTPSDSRNYIDDKLRLKYRRAA